MSDLTQSRARRRALAVVLYLFGLAITGFVISVWGRAVTTDRETVTEAASAVGRLDAVEDRLLGWVGALAGTEGGATGQIVEDLREAPGVGEALGDLVGEVIAASLSAPGPPITVDPAASLIPLAPEVAVVLQRNGLSVDVDEVEAALATIEPLVIDPGDPEGPAAAVTGVHNGLTVAALFTAGLVVLLGAGAVALSNDRRAQLKSLGWRLVLSGVSFTIVTSLSAWLLDPGGGASPARSALASVLRSNREVPILVALAGAAVAGLVVILWKRRDVILRRGGPDEESDTTGERELVRIG